LLTSKGEALICNNPPPSEPVSDSRGADQASVDELEELLDRTYLANPLPHQNRAFATWYCLVASEDAQRNLFTQAGDGLSSGSLLFYLDRFKYSMRYALARLAKETRDLSWPTVPRKIIGKLYMPAARLMVAGLDYSLAAQLCGALRSGTAACRKEPDAWRVEIDEARHDKAYGALELMGIKANQQTLSPPSGIREELERFAGIDP
jgi:hypothetical protein